MNGIIWDWNNTQEARSERTPSGTAENKFVASFEAQWKPLPRIGFNGSITGIFSHNNNHISDSEKLGGQASFGVSYQF